MSAEYDRIAEEKKRRQLAYAKRVQQVDKPLFLIEKSESKGIRKSKNILIKPNFKIDWTWLILIFRDYSKFSVKLTSKYDAE